jgi:hypothetical protein
MEEKDLKQIGEVIDQKFSEGFHKEFEQIWENNLSPAFDEVNQRFDKIEGRLSNVESQMVTKSYLDDKLADLEGGVISKLRKEDEKVNRIISLLKKHKVVPPAELEDLDNLQIFPKIQI